jgi:hypothetical protein
LPTEAAAWPWKSANRTAKPEKIVSVLAGLEKTDSYSQASGGTNRPDF